MSSTWEAPPATAPADAPQPAAGERPAPGARRREIV